MKHTLRARIDDLVSKGISEAEILAMLEGKYPSTGIKQLQQTKIHNREELIGKLRSFQPAAIIERYKQQFLTGKSAKELLLFTMDNSIYRAFHHETPSQRYSKWRWHSDSDQLLEKMREIRDQETFDLLAFEMGESLVNDWGTKNNLGRPTKMNIGIAMKIINLALKHFSFSDLSPNPDLINWLHVPWDSFTLRQLRNIWPWNPAIPNNVSQGFVNNLTTYQQLHTLISEITQEAGVPRITYELWAWDASH
jgi:hypothetical protein